jgi:hypothetical protein
MFLELVMGYTSVILTKKLNKEVDGRNKMSDKCKWGCVISLSFITFQIWTEFVAY